MTMPERVWRIVSEFGVLWKWTSCKDEADRQENYGRQAIAYVPAASLSQVQAELEIAGRKHAELSRDFTWKHEEILQLRAQISEARKALETIASLCPEGRISIVPQIAIQQASKIAREALAAMAEGKADE